MTNEQLIELLQAYSERFWGYTVDERMIVNFLKDTGVKLPTRVTTLESEEIREAVKKAAHTKSTRQSLVAEIRSKMPPKRPTDYSRNYPTGTGGLTNMTTENQRDSGYNQAIESINLILTEIEGER